MFSDLGVEKLSTVKQLNEEYAELLAKKKEAYREYRKAKQEMTDFATAKYDIERLLNLEKKRKPGREKKQKQKRRRFSPKGHFIGITSSGMPLLFCFSRSAISTQHRGARRRSVDANLLFEGIGSNSQQAGLRICRTNALLANL